MRSPDEIWTELRAVNDQLTDATTNDERQRLADRKHELQILARQMSSDSTPSAVLETELEELERRWTALQQQRVDPVRQAGGGGEGTFGFATDAWSLNQKIDESAGRSEIESRIAEIKRILVDRSSED